MLIFKEKSSSEFDFFRVFALYESSFPPDERRSESDFRKKIESEPRLHLDSTFTDGGDFLGFIAYWDFGTFIYAEHLAVNPQLRGHGTGGKILDHLMQASGKPLILEVEPPTGPMERRRIAFYERHGLRLWPDVDYLQPPYDPGKQPLPLLLMTAGFTSQAQVEQAAQVIRREVYGAQDAVNR